MNEQSNKLSRRQFMGVVGGVAGAAALASIPLDGHAEVNMPEIDLDNFKSNSEQHDVLVIGGGMAGLFAAVKAHDAGAKTIMVSKGRLGSSGLTPFAKGIFSYDKNNASMSIDEFVRKVGVSSIDTNNPVFTRQLCEHSYDRVQELKEWGFFDSPLCNKTFMKPMQEREIDLHERIMITHLIKENGRVIGASGFSLDEEKIIHYHAKTVILCTGAGGFKPNGFPVCDLTHDGTIMAYNIGAKVTGKEWNDGHPGRAENSGSSYDTWNGQIEEKPSTTEVQINHHLGVDLNYKAYKQGAPLTMGPGSSGQEVSGGPYVPAEFQEEERRPPSDGESADERKGPPPGGSQGGLFSFFSNNQSSGPPGMGGEQVGGSSAGMAIHKAEGLVPVDETGLSTIPGLYAAGDALGSYMSGGIYTQIGSSLAGSAVQGAISGEAAAKASQSIESIAIPTVKMQQIEDEILAPLNRTQGYSPAWVTQVLQGVMIPNFVLYIKKETMMRGALAYVQELKEHHTPMLIAKDMHTLRLAHETENMIITAEMKLKASLERTESRCSHYRLDYPDVDYNSWQAWLNIWKSENGEMKFEKQPFGTWPTV